MTFSYYFVAFIIFTGDIFIKVFYVFRTMVGQ